MGDFRGLWISNQTCRSRTDEEARLFRKSSSTGAFLSDLGHSLMENRPGLVVAREVQPKPAWQSSDWRLFQQPPDAGPGVGQENCRAANHPQGSDRILDCRHPRRPGSPGHPEVIEG